MAFSRVSDAEKFHKNEDFPNKNKTVKNVRKKIAAAPSAPGSLFLPWPTRGLPGPVASHFGDRMASHPPGGVGQGLKRGMLRTPGRPDQAKFYPVTPRMYACLFLRRL